MLKQQLLRGNMNTEGTQYENLKFKAEIYRTAAFAVASLFGSIVIHAVLVGLKLGWMLFWQLLAALISFICYLTFINISQSIMNDREWRIKRERRMDK
jgi:amino acid permease